MHVVVVERNWSVVSTIGEMLSERGHRVTALSDGAALREFLTSGDPADAVVLDASIELDHSAALTRDLKKRRIPVVVISGNPAALEFAYNQHRQVLPKPFRSHQLYDALHQALTSGEF
jgi:CheY-like chemotaxis protein